MAQENSLPSKPKSFLEEAPGQQSSMRVMSFIALLASIAFGLISLLHSKASDADGLYLTSFFLLAAFAPKALQKFAEAKLPGPKT